MFPRKVFGTWCCEPKCRVISAKASNKSHSTAVIYCRIGNFPASSEHNCFSLYLSRRIDALCCFPFWFSIKRDGVAAALQTERAQHGEVIIKSFPLDLLGKIAPSCVRWIGNFGPDIGSRQQHDCDLYICGSCSARDGNRASVCATGDKFRCWELPIPDNVMLIIWKSCPG